MRFAVSTLTALCALATTATATEEASDRGLSVANEGTPKDGSLSDPSDSFVPKRILRSRSITERERQGNSIKNDSKEDNNVDGTSPEMEHVADLGILEDPKFRRNLQDSCKDDKDFVRTSKPGLGQGCDWVLSGNLEPSQTEFRCNRPESGGKVWDFCPKSCNVCTSEIPVPDTDIDCQELCGTDRPVIGTDQSFQQSVSFKLFPGYAGYTEGSVVYPGDIECWDTSQVTDMSYAFRPPIRKDTDFQNPPYYRSVFNEPLRCWDTSRVTSMQGMFANTKLVGPGRRAPVQFNNVLLFNTSAVTSMANMFFRAERFNQLVNFDTSSVTDMSGMFSYTRRFDKPLDFDTSSVTDISGMFENAYRFNQPVNFNTSKVQRMNFMFESARSFNQPLNFDTSLVYDMEGMFEDALDFNQPLSSFDTSNVQNMQGMFRRAKRFNQPLSSFDTSNVPNMNGMFRDATQFNQDLSNFDTSSATTFENMFRGAVEFDQPLSFDTSSAYNMKGMFRSALKFNQPLTSFNTSNVNSDGMSYFFESARSFNQPLDTFDVSKTESLFRMFYSADKFNQPISDWDTSSVTSMRNMFKLTPSFNQPIVSWTTSKVTDMQGMFEESLFNQPLDTFDTSNVRVFAAMFANNPDFNQPVDNALNVSSATSFRDMFLGASSFNQVISTWAGQLSSDFLYLNSPDFTNFDTAPISDFYNMFTNSGCPNQPQPGFYLDYDPSISYDTFWKIDKTWCQFKKDDSTPAPTPAPSSPTTNPPTNTPDKKCKDSAYKAIVNGKGRTCRWIERNGLCESRKYAFHCRSSCGKCATCRDSLARFIMPGDMFKNGKPRKIRCSTLRKDPRKEQRCKNLSNAYTCPGTCRKYANRNPCGSNVENPE